MSSWPPGVTNDNAEIAEIAEIAGNAGNAGNGNYFGYTKRRLNS